MTEAAIIAKPSRKVQTNCNINNGDSNQPGQIVGRRLARTVVPQASDTRIRTNVKTYTISKNKKLSNNHKAFVATILRIALKRRKQKRGRITFFLPLRRSVKAITSLITGRSAIHRKNKSRQCNKLL